MKTLLLALAIATMQPAATTAQERAEVTLETTKGNIRLALYNETPQHRDNFLKLVGMHFYDSLLFHRVVKDFMIQGGDITSRNAQPGQRLGTGELDYTLEPEFRLPKLFHRRGVLAAAREGDEINPEMRSGASQFYIVWGQQLDDRQLDFCQQKLNEATKGRVQLTDSMRHVYKTQGGTPHLDGQYTVFGEVIEGLDVVDAIQQMPTDRFARPLQDVRILKASVTRNPFAPKEQPKAKPQRKTRRNRK